MPALRGAVAALAAVTAVAFLAAAGPDAPPRERPGASRPRFIVGDRCMPCHNGLTTSAGRDVSIGFDWRATIMANSSRDPYWQGSVRREVLEHSAARRDVEDECSICHMPMLRYVQHAAGWHGAVFDHLPERRGTDPLDSLAADGVSCTTCHQIQQRRLGEPSSFDGGFVIDAVPPGGRPPVFGPYEVDRGHRTIMHSSSGFVPTRGDHIRSAELCATCHTLYTTALGERGDTIGRLPEQVPFLEWKHSAFVNERSCQDCHMPPMVAEGDSVAITAVLGVPRPGPKRHVFAGGNFFVLGMLARHRAELAVEALPQELDAAVASTREMLSHAATVALEPAPAAASADGRLAVDVLVTNLNGHKLPTAFPSRRAWLHVTVRDRGGAVVFESGAVMPSGRIVGNDNDDDRTRYEPHWREITRPDQVEIYESILKDRHGNVTTGLLSSVGYLKDNRLLPRGFEKATAGADFAVIGDAASDPAFAGGSDRVRYRVDVSRAQPPFRVDAELWYQPIGFRWAHNLSLRPAPETDRFVAWFDAMADHSAIVLARDSVTIR
ncbi:MAG TPA: hypothetical protein VFS44_01505 [Gemmatimonadaceae bacterium]|nr:hypothetical protein [Gemmatimonadaceae bacterium]